MAYVDARNTRENLGAFAAVTLLEVGLVAAVIAGLAYKAVVAPPTPRTTATTIELPPPPPPKEQRRAERQTETTITKPPIDDPIVIINPPPSGESELGTGNETIGGGTGVGTATFPIPRPEPSFAPVKARPRGNHALWVSENDYPSSEIRLEHEGTTKVRLSIDTKGKVADCAVTASSGWPVLDRTACEKLIRRGRFEPASDSTGAPTLGSFTTAIRWQLPE
jgi:protein TonB